MASNLAIAESDHTMSNITSDPFLALTAESQAAILASLEPKKALIIMDPQNGFCPGGSLAVPDGDKIMAKINRLRRVLQPDAVFITQDWHPEKHCSFQVNNPGSELFKPFTLADGTVQMMWPAHCVQGSADAQFHPKLELAVGDIVIRKGTLEDVDSYSGFGSQPAADGSRKEVTMLEANLRAQGIKHVYVVGLAFDYCVSYTAKDAAKAGFTTWVIRDCTKPVASSSAAAEEAAMREAGVIILDTFAAGEM